MLLDFLSLSINLLLLRSSAFELPVLRINSITNKLIPKLECHSIDNVQGSSAAFSESTTANIIKIESTSLQHQLANILDL